MKKYCLLLCTLVLAVFSGCNSSKSTPSARSVGVNADRLKLVDNVINNSITSGEIPGAVLGVVHKDKLIYLNAYGNKQTYPVTEPMTANTVFDLASVTKPLSTAISAMILIERGQLRLQDNVSYYLPDFTQWVDSTGTYKKNIRIVNLLTHTSGLPSYASVSELQKKYSTPDPEGLMEHISSVKRRFEPGTDFDYSCLNFITLQHIIEKISGQSLDEFARQNIYQPLGMKYTGYRPQGDILELVAPTEKQKDGSVLKGEVHDPLARIMNGGISGNAGLFSNAADLAVLASMLMNGGEYNGVQILSPLGVEAMTSVPHGYEAFGRTLGWDMYSSYSSNKGDLLSHNTYGHTGYTGTSFIIDPDNQLAIILLTNRAHPYDKGTVSRLRSLVANVVAASLVDN